MSIYRKPILFTIVAAVVVLIGSIFSTFLPLFMPEMTPADDAFTPYTALELEGRDIYIREGCNNCHTQTVRPLLFETARYGPPSQLGEFTYDRPHLWGSKRTGPDLARIGGKYPDSWHIKHMTDPQSMFPESNMPPYPWLAEKALDTRYTEKKMKTLGFPLRPGEVSALNGLTELDAMVAYLQKLGSDLKKETTGTAMAAAAPAADAGANPFAGDREAAEEGEAIYATSCAVCHGEELQGGIGPVLKGGSWKYGGTDAELYQSISGGRPGGMPAWEPQIGRDRIWKVIAYLREEQK